MPGHTSNSSDQDDQDDPNDGIPVRYAVCITRSARAAVPAIAPAPAPPKPRHYLAIPPPDARHTGLARRFPSSERPICPLFVR
ncbi:hypothetical protein PSP6_290005 [Paraburkholderia tropica]|nr:hypothetical protein PSP6_290005 [Paraburkholderia tropica]